MIWFICYNTTVLQSHLLECLFLLLLILVIVFYPMTLYLRDITLCIKIHKPLASFIGECYEMTSQTMPHIYDKILMFTC